MTELSNAVGRELVESISSLFKLESNGETRRGDVTRVDPDGRTWVRIEGNDFETCCVRSSVACKPGDSVLVAIRNNRATIEGNYTSPATDDSKAEEAIRTGSSAQQTADMAHELATNAIADAQATRDAAERAEADAQRAADAADSAAGSAESAAISAANSADSAERAEVSAKSAEKSALDANWAANGALNSLGTVQDVMGTLEWLNANSIKMPAVPEKTTDTEVNPGHVYYVKGEDGTFSKVDEPTADGLADYYSIKPGTAYFVLNDQTNLYEPVEFPDFADIASYFVVDKQSTMANFVQSHLTLTNGEKGGLYITKQMPYEKGSDGSVTVNELWEVGDEYDFDDGRRPLTEDDVDVVGRPKNPQAAGYIKLATTGVEIYDMFGNKVATYGPTTTIGGPGGQTTIESDVLAVGKFHTKTVDGVAQVVFDNVFSAGTGEDGKSFLRFSDGAGNDLFTVDSIGKPTFAKPVPIPSGGTSADNRGDAADNLLVQSIGGGTELTPTEAVGSVDLNSIKTPGNYVAGRSSWVASMANKPAKLNSAFRLTVWKVLGNTPGSLNNSIIAQVIREYNTGREFYRVNGGSGWTAWVCGVRDNEVIDVPHGGTNAGTPRNAAQNLLVPSLVGTTSLGSNTDLNTVVKFGTYYCASSNTVRTWKNCPTTYALRMTVANGTGMSYDAAKLTGTYLVQEIVDLYANVYRRQSSDGGSTWGAWSRSVMSTDVIDRAHGGTGKNITSDPSMLVNLGSTSADLVFKSAPRPGVTGQLPSANIANGAITADKLASDSVTNAKLDSTTKYAVENVVHSAAVATAMGGGTFRLVKKGHVRILTINPFYFNGDTAKWTDYQIGSIVNPDDRPPADVCSALCCDGGVALLWVKTSGVISINTRNTVITNNQWCYGQAVW